MSIESLQASLSTAMDAVRRHPNDASARMQLFRLFAVTGQWDRAGVQADTASKLDSTLAFTTMFHRQTLSGERFREAVFAGQRTPVIAGEPPRWLAFMVEALKLAPAAAAALRAQALDDAAPVTGTLDGQPFEWIADADSRLGPVCECFIDGKYYWVPFERISRITLNPPDDVLDMVWTSAEITFSGGGAKHAIIPSRYPGSEASDDDDIRLCRKTVWAGDDETGWHGLGQRVWSTDAVEVGLLDVRCVELG